MTAKFSRFDITKEQLQGWISEGKSDATIGRALGCSQSIIEKRRKELGISPSRPKHFVAVDCITLAKLVEQGNSDRMIGEILGCSGVVVGRRRAAYGIAPANPKSGGKRAYLPEDVSPGDVAAAEFETASDIAFKRRIAGQKFVDNPKIRVAVGPLGKPLPAPEQHSATGNSSQMCAS